MAAGTKLAKLSVNTLYFILTILGIYYLGWSMQSDLLLTQDVSWLMTASRRLLAGGSYTNDFFEINPPMILYLYIPPVLLSKFLPIITPTALIVYVFSLVTASLCICAHLAKVYFGDTNNSAGLLILSLAAIFLIIPIYTFGQREHLLVIFIMPYLLLLTCRLEHTTPNTRAWSYYAFFIGLYAGLGFAMKPHFLFPLILIELYYLYCSRSLLAWLRPECIAIATLMIAYATSTLVFHPDYLQTVIPFSMRFYYEGIRTSLLSVYNNPPVIYCAMIALFYLAAQPTKNKNLINILFLSMLGLLLTYFIAKTNWFYHIVPAYSLGVLLSAMLVASILQQEKLNYLSILTLVIFCFFATIALFPYYEVAESFIFMRPTIFYLFFFAIFIYLLLTNNKNYSTFSSFIATLVIISAGALVNYIVSRDDFYQYTFLLTLTMLISLFWYSAIKLTRNANHILIIALLSMIVFTYPTISTTLKFDMEKNFLARNRPLIYFLKENAENKSVFFFTTASYYEYPAIDYSNSRSTSRTQDLAWIPGILKASKNALTVKDTQQAINDRNFLINIVINDITSKRPDFIFIDTSTRKSFLEGISFNHLDFFMKNKEFKKMWSHYTFYQNIKLSNETQFQVFKRTNPTPTSSQTTY